MKKIEDKSDIRYKKEEIEYETRTKSEQVGYKIITTKQKYKRIKYTDYNGKVSFDDWKEEGEPEITEKQVEKETKYITIYKNTHEDLEESDDRSFYISGKMYYSSTHRHPLVFLDKSRDTGWTCNGKDLIDKCFSGITDFNQTEGIPRFRCQDCDYNLCEKCMNHSRLIYGINKLYQTSVHSHPLKCLGKSEINSWPWLCDGRNCSEGCFSGITKSYQTKGVERFRCKECDFDLCRNCMDYYLKREKGCIIF